MTRQPEAMVWIHLVDILNEWIKYNTGYQYFCYVLRHIRQATKNQIVHDSIKFSEIYLKSLELNSLQFACLCALVKMARNQDLGTKHPITLNQLKYMYNVLWKRGSFENVQTT